MPIPQPKSGESEQDFISRCMGNEAMLSEFPEQEQRAAVCYREFRASMDEDVDKARTVSGYESPEPGDLPEKYARLLANVYAQCREENPSYSEERCSKIAWGAVNRARKAKEEYMAKKQIAFTEKMKRVHEYLKKQLASFKTTANGEHPHYHYFDVDSAGNGETVTTISTEDIPQEGEDHSHNISKWEVRTTAGHTHALDKVVKAKRGRPKKVCMITPSRDMFKTFEEFDKAMKAYLGRKSKSKMAPATHLSKSYITAVMKRSLELLIRSA